MANNLKIKKYWLTTLCMVFCSLSSFAQDLSDATIGFDVARATASLREHGVKNQDIESEITKRRELFQTQYLTMKKSTDSISKKIRSEQLSNAMNNRSAAGEIPQIEIDALKAIFNSTNGANWRNKGGWDGLGGAWYGVQFNNGHVSEINLDSNNLSGTIPKEIENLPYLRVLSLNSNKITGEIPKEIGKLTILYNLGLSGNQLTGNIPTEIGNMAELTLLYISSNQLSGSIPKQIGNVSKLYLFYANGNNLSGSIPVEIGNLQKLQEVRLSQNKLTGEVPVEIANLNSLVWLVLQDNSLSGTIPPRIFKMTKASFIYLGNNNFTGVIPTDIGDNPNLYILDLSINKLSGPIPPSIGKLKILRGLTLAYNSLQGEIPSELSNCIGLFRLTLNNNQLEGEVKLNFQELNTLYELNLASNKLTGKISDFSTQTYLKLLNLSDNKFRFVDFIDQFNAHKSKGAGFSFSPQAKIGNLETINKNSGSSVVLDMFLNTDNRSHELDTYQWFKNGTEITGAVTKTYTINNLSDSDAGLYTCKAYHSTNPDMSPLILEREAITLQITNCPSAPGTLKSTAEKFYTNAQSKFSFETTATGLTYEWSAATATGTPVNTLPSGTKGSYSYTFTEVGDYVVTLIAKDANQCSTTFTKAVKVVDRYCAKEPVDFAFETTSTNLNYTWTSTDSSGNIVNTVTNRTGLYTFTPELPGDYVIELVANGASQCVSLFTKNITIDECVPFISCTKDNPLSPEMHRLFITMISKLATAPNGSDVNVYAHKEIAAMAPYTTEKTAMIYNFINTSSAISFSFTKTATESDIYLPKSATGSITAIDLSKYEDALTATTVATTYTNGIPNTKDGHVKNIDFCPKELSCVSHVALVIDESGSIDASEFNKIKKQLKSFVLQQAKTNDDIGSNIHVSITGMSDSDVNTRTDYIEPLKMTMSNVGLFNDWIDQLGKRYGKKTGISQASDYWKSGLDGALAYKMKPTFVIMVTDGAQTDDVAGLRATFKKFNNNNKAETEPKLPHLYVVGIENGFYIDRDSYTSKGIPRDQDPNYNPSLAPKDNLTARTTPFLTKSLQYLLDLTPTEWPLSDINQFTVGTYYGHDNFELLASDETYFSDKLADGKVVCGTAAIKDFCDDCFSFKPEPGKEYILSAWVKEESFIQVKNYENPAIKIVFYNNKEALDIPAQRIDSLVVKANGDIIDGWQRVVKKFKIPTATITMAIELENMSPSIPVYFDDIRIHPLQGSVKSFVYDPVTFKLMSELDENNYSTFYEYDNEGGLVRVKKETAKGIKTIQETRSGSVINITQ
ncbi:VWA domain-containing protein [Flavobacterium sp. ENC]|uniref:VWA domain-containing protein n=1 Tax=Flavobacterium sp. ENC TaxID=2897330 RepID=UPI001E56B25F|nr:VWA domain-containing protein [Flavobacterium sp. ENC]MCD0467445.1 VWA domain-containing protein [Flavobacterium sp. ENC]